MTRIIQAHLSVVPMRIKKYRFYHILVPYFCRSVLYELPVLESLQRFDASEIIGLCETWLSDKVTDPLLSLGSTYTVFRSDMYCSMKAGGVAVIAKKHLPFEATEMLALNSGCEIVRVNSSCANAYQFRS